MFLKMFDWSFSILRSSSQFSTNHSEDDRKIENVQSNIFKNIFIVYQYFMFLLLFPFNNMEDIVSINVSNKQYFKTVRKLYKYNSYQTFK